MQFSVVITTHNRAGTLPRAIKNVQSQFGVDFELIVIDDGSTDEPVMLLGNICDPHVAWICRADSGLSAARHTEIAQASCDWITFLDDVALPVRLSGLVAELEAPYWRSAPSHGHRRTHQVRELCRS